MPLFTTTAAVTALWAGFELVVQVVIEQTTKKTAKPLTAGIAEWIQQRSGWKDKKRQRVFFDAYHRAEERLIEKCGLAKAYRILRSIPSIMDAAERREQLVFGMLGEPTEEQSDMSSRLARSWQEAFQDMGDEDAKNLRHFMTYLRECLHDTDIFRPLVEFCATEEAQSARLFMAKELQQLASTVDSELRAIRVTLVESANLEAERQIYLEQLGAFLEEQEFVGFPDLREQKRPIRLSEIYVPLSLNYDGGGESLNDEIGQLIAVQSQVEEGE